MPELCRQISTIDETLLFLQIPKAAGRSVLEILNKEGWKPKDSPAAFLNHFEIRLHYKKLKVKPPRSFAIVRHPFRRIEAAFAEGGRSKNPHEMFLKIEEMSTHDFYTIWNRQLRPGSDFVLDNTIICHLEDGMQKAIRKLAAVGWVSYKANLSHVGKGKRQKLDWEKAPKHIIQKLMQVYAEDLYYFQYPLFPCD